MKKLICFDLDNTLIYSDKCHVLAYNYALKKENLEIPKRNLNRFWLEGLAAKVVRRSI